MKLSREQVAAALRDADGYVGRAAKALGVHRVTVQRYMARFPELAPLARRGRVFGKPGSYRTVSDVAREAGISSRTLYRGMAELHPERVRREPPRAARPTLREYRELLELLDQLTDVCAALRAENRALRAALEGAE